MANKKISELPYIDGSKISGNTLVPLVTYFSATTGDTVHTFVDDFQTYILSGLTGNTVVGDFLPLTGGTVSGATRFLSGLTANTISADTLTVTDNISSTNRTLYRAPSGGFLESVDYGNSKLWSVYAPSIDWELRQIFDEQGTMAINYSGVTRYLMDDTGQQSVDWQARKLYTFIGDEVFDWENGILTGQTNIQSSIISATTYQNLPTDIKVTGGTYSAGTITFTNNTGGTFNVTGLTTGSTSTISGDYLPLSGGTVSGTTYFTQGVSGSTVSATTFNFNTGYTGSTLVGQMNWNQDFGVPQVGMVGGNVVQKVGESVYAYVKNVDTTTLNKGDVVYAFGASGDKMSVKRASNTGDTTSSKTLGIVAESIAVNGLGYVITQGTIDGLNLGSYTAGDLVWLSSVPGQFTKTKQYSPYHLVFVGVVQRANAGNGQLYVKPQNGYELEEIHDVIATGATYGDILVYSAYGSNDVWVSTKTLNGSYTITGNTNIGGGLTATTISATTYQNLPVPSFFNPGTASTINWDVSGVSNNYTATLTASTTTINVDNIRNGEYATIILTQDSVGSRTINLGTINGTSGSGRHKVSSGGGGLIYLTSNPNAVDILSCVYDGNILYWTVGNDYN